MQRLIRRNLVKPLGDSSDGGSNLYVHPLLQRYLMRCFLSVTEDFVSRLFTNLCSLYQDELHTPAYDYFSLPHGLQRKMMDIPNDSLQVVARSCCDYPGRAIELIHKLYPFSAQSELGMVCSAGTVGEKLYFLYVSHNETIIPLLKASCCYPGEDTPNDFSIEDLKKTQGITVHLAFFFPNNDSHIILPGEIMGIPIQDVIRVDCCGNAKTLEIQNGIRTLSNGALRRLGLKEIYLPDSLETIGAMCFWADSIRKITIPQGVKRIGTGAFSACSDLEKITFQGAPEFGNTPFRDCGKLTTFVLDDACIKFPRKAFRNCSNVREIIAPGNWKLIRVDEGLTREDWVELLKLDDWDKTWIDAVFGCDYVFNGATAKIRKSIDDLNADELRYLFG